MLASRCWRPSSHPNLLTLKTHPCAAFRGAADPLHGDTYNKMVQNNAKVGVDGGARTRNCSHAHRSAPCSLRFFRWGMIFAVQELMDSLFDVQDANGENTMGALHASRPCLTSQPLFQHPPLIALAEERLPPGSRPPPTGLSSRDTSYQPSPAQYQGGGMQPTSGAPSYTTTSSGHYYTEGTVGASGKKMWGMGNSPMKDGVFMGGMGERESINTTRMRRVFNNQHSSRPTTTMPRTYKPSGPRQNQDQRVCRG